MEVFNEPSSSPHRLTSLSCVGSVWKSWLLKDSFHWHWPRSKWSRLRTPCLASPDEAVALGWCHLRAQAHGHFFHMDYKVNAIAFYCDTFSKVASSGLTPSKPSEHWVWKEGDFLLSLSLFKMPVQENKLTSPPLAPQSPPLPTIPKKKGQPAHWSVDPKILNPNSLSLSLHSTLTSSLAY